jgi:hypothetical protein
MQSGTHRLSILRAGWCPLKTRGLWTADRLRCTRTEIVDGAARELMMEATHPVFADGREGFVRFTHGCGSQRLPMKGSRTRAFRLRVNDLGKRRQESRPRSLGQPHDA